MENKLKGSLCYLSGPMEAADDGGESWRNEISPQLKRLGVGVLNPCYKSGANPHDEFDRRTKANNLKSEGKSKFAEIRALYQPLVREDLRMVDISSFIIVYLDGTPACGTYDEIFMAAQQRKPVIVIAPNGWDKLSNWLFGRLNPDLFFLSIAQAMMYIQGIDSGEIIPDSKWRFFDYDAIFKL